MLKQRNTIQKTLIITAVRKLHHPTADEVYSSVVKEYPNISKATVYRNLKSMEEQGIVRKIRTMDGSDGFDHKLIRHYHFKCLKCKNIFDLELAYMDELNCKVSSCGGFVVEEHEIIFTGICPKCKIKYDK